MADPTKTVSKDKVDRVKRRLLMNFRQMLKGAKLTENITRFLSGELGASYRFQSEIVLNEEIVRFADDPKNSEALSKENLE